MLKWEYMSSATLVFFYIFILFSSNLWASSNLSSSSQNQASSTPTLKPSTFSVIPPGQRPLLLAQDASDTYDPFVDFSEYEEVTDEEADINFFRNGRFFTLGFAGGYQMFTNVLGNLYQNNFSYGFFLSYFFDLRFAMQLTFQTSEHGFAFTSDHGTSVSGSASVSNLGIYIKYYLNTQNVTRGLAQLNPYIVGGLDKVTRTTVVDGEDAFGKESASGFEFGGGIEIPALRNKMYLGVQLTYLLVTFADESSQIVLQNGADPTGVYPKGDIINLNFVIGVNF